MDSSFSQGYPSKPIHNILNVGGGGETIARLVAGKMSESMGVPIVIEQNTAGAGSIASAQVSRSAPDGYTFLYTTTNAQLYRVFLAREVPYDPVKDFTPIGKLGEAILTVAVPPDSPFKSMGDVVAWAKANPGRLTYATSGVGTTHHLSAELLSTVAGIQMLHVPYKDSNQAATDTLTGRIQINFTIFGTVFPFAKAGKLRLIALNNSKRYKLMPDLPTIGEQVPGYEPPPGWTAYFGPPGMPRPIVDRLNAEIIKAINNPEVLSRMDALGLVVVTSTPEELAASLKRDLERTAAIVKAAGIKPE
jgi:tripartite-type tricarboxylate transporter receptor subunit TctC